MGFLIISWLVAMVLSVLIAKNNGRSMGWALFMSFIFGWIAVIVYACIGKPMSQRITEAIRKSNSI